MQRSSEQDGGMATKTGLWGRGGGSEGGEDSGDESKQHQVATFFIDGVKTFTRADKQAD